ncbi:MAG: chemotaxis protein CheX [Acidobacteriia bacterium]|nr:chemotaxis protein CheX [Terriglobia bacterium]
MSVDTSAAVRSQEENWQPVLELAVEEVFEIMVGCRVKPAPISEPKPNGEFTAMIGLAGSLCGVLTVGCDAQTARQLAKGMLGDIVSSKDQVSDALGEICNMVAGNFKNKLTGMDGRCLLSVPTVISGGEYQFRSLAAGNVLDVCVLFEGAPVAVRLELHG